MHDEDETSRDLAREELVVLAGALRLMMMADQRVTAEELSSIEEIGWQLGLSGPQWDEIWEAASQQLRGAEAVRDAAGALSREAAREAIYEMLYRLADSDSIADEEWDLLEWLDQTWLAAGA